ncbi:MAG: hypothetical protein WDN72_04905 [Alphaproteobacteria bacterium]
MRPTAEAVAEKIIRRSGPWRRDGSDFVAVVEQGTELPLMHAIRTLGGSSTCDEGFLGAIVGPGQWGTHCAVRVDAATAKTIGEDFFSADNVATLRLYLKPAERDGR